MPTKTHPSRLVTLAAAVAIIPLAAFCSPAPEPPMPTEPMDAGTMLLALYNARVPMDGLLSGGQPTREQIEAAARGGFRTVINLRTDKEPGFEWERDAVEQAGMRYVQIPIAGGDGLTHENVERVDAALRESLAQGPVLLHCGSGNRIGALLALREAWLAGKKPEEALASGLASGLTRLEGRVREILELPSAEATDGP